MSSKPFFVIGLATVMLSYGYTIWQYRLKQERSTGVVSETTKWLGWLVKSGFVLVPVLIIGVVAWMSRGN